MTLFKPFLLTAFVFCLQIQQSSAQTDSLLRDAGLEQLTQYALRHKPGIKQSYIDQEVGERDIKSALSGWLPQVSGDASFSHNIKQQVNALTTDGQTSYIVFGTKNVSSLILQTDQKILDAGLIQASKTAKYYRQQFRQNTENNQINTVVDVSKAYYDILTSQEQLKIINENIARIEKQLKDAKSQYISGLVDKTDSQRAQISLSNSLADRNRTTELLKSKYAYIKAIIGYPTEAALTLSFDNTSMEKNILLDTTEVLDYQKRVEYRLLETQQRLLGINTSYNKLAYLPRLSGFINYSWNYLDDNFSNLYKNAYPGSIVGLRLSMPIFQGTKRIQEIRKAQLLEKRGELDLLDSKNNINNQFERAMATYKAGLNDWRTAGSNVSISKDVYKTIKLQYDEGIKTYLDLMTAESDLRTSQLYYLNALYSLLSAKLDVQQALGSITITP